MDSPSVYISLLHLHRTEVTCYNCTAKNKCRKFETIIPKKGIARPQNITNFQIHVSVSDLYISTINLPILLQENMRTDPGNIKIAYRHINVEVGTEAAQFPEKEYENGIFVAVWDIPSLL
jgi:hypothetical protein